MTAAAATRDGPAVTDRGAIELLRTALADAGYDEDGLAAIGIGEPLRPESAELPYHELGLVQAGRLGTLVRLFQLALPVAAGEAAGAIEPAPLDRLQVAGLLERVGDAVRATVALAPVLGVLLASDWEPAAAPPRRRDHVLGPSSPSRILARLAGGDQVDSALDLCTGSGLHALLAARRARRVVATDLNPRALRFAELNAALNAVDIVETREGSLFQPVAGETFDAISANPPYVVSPEAEFAFRDGGLRGDAFSETLVRALPAHLREGGTAHVLVSWVHQADEDWATALRRWLDGSGCDALLLHHVSQAPLEHANDQNRMHWRDPERYRDELARWVAHLDDLGVERIAWGAVVLRKRTGGANHVTALHLALTACGPAAHHVRRLLDAQRAVAGLDANARLRVVSDARLEQTVAFRDGEGVLERARLRLEDGLRLEIELDPQVPKLLSLLDAGATVGEATAEAARALSGDGSTPERVASAALASIRLLLETGFLEAR